MRLGAEPFSATLDNLHTVRRVIATACTDGDQALNQGTDVSHRGGKPGFVKVLDDRTFVFPYFSGNNHFNTVGNIVLNPKVGFLFVDFEARDLVYMTGTAEIVGLAAPIVVLHLRRDPNCATSSGLVRFQYLGLLDFAVAIVTAGLSAGAFASLTPGGVTSAPMNVWPLNLFPSFIVPIFIILHLTVLLKVRELRRRETNPATAVIQTA